MSEARSLPAQNHVTSESHSLPEVSPEDAKDIDEVRKHLVKKLRALLRRKDEPTDNLQQDNPPSVEVTPQ